MLTKVEETTQIEKLKELIKLHSPNAHIFTASIQAGALRRFIDDAIQPFETTRGRQAVGLCSIGDPESFFSMLENLGCRIVKKLAFADHHWYNSDDYTVINSCGQGADFIITTEKDIVKLDKTMIDNKKIFILETEMRIEREDEFFQTLSTLAGL